jgi:hypothetical protein
MFENLKFAGWKPNYIGMEEIHGEIRKIIQSGLEVDYRPSKYISKEMLFLQMILCQLSA